MVEGSEFLTSYMGAGDPPVPRTIAEMTGLQRFCAALDRSFGKMPAALAETARAFLTPWTLVAIAAAVGVGTAVTGGALLLTLTGGAYFGQDAIRRFIEAGGKATRATTDPEIDLAAWEMAQALIQFGLAVLPLTARSVRAAPEVAAFAQRLGEGAKLTFMTANLRMQLLWYHPYTKIHCDEVATLAEAAGRALGLSAEDLRLLSLEGKLHDIGKLKVPVRILDGKNAQLSPEDWQLMASHAQAGDAILSRTGSQTLEMIGHRTKLHHTNINNSQTARGYPVAPEELPLAERILRIVDSFHAMITSGRERPLLFRFWRGGGRYYQRAFSQEEAVANLQKGMGTDFDPVLTPQVIAALQHDPKAVRLIADAMRDHSFSLSW